MISLFLATVLQLPEVVEGTARHVMRRSPAVAPADISSAQVNLWIAPDGRVLECTLSRSMGTEIVAKELCDAAVGARLKPARDVSGAEIHSLFRTTLSTYPGGWEPVASQQTRNLGLFDRHYDLINGFSAMPATLTSDPRITVNVPSSSTCQTVERPVAHPWD